MASTGRGRASRERKLCDARSLPCALCGVTPRGPGLASPLLTWLGAPLRRLKMFALLVAGRPAVGACRCATQRSD